MSREFEDLSILGHLTDLQNHANNNLRAREMGDRQLRHHYGESYKTPNYDDNVRYNSPTTVHHHQPQQNNPWPWLAMMALGAAGAFAYWASQNRPDPPDTINNQTTEVWRLEAGESGGSGDTTNPE